MPYDEKQQHAGDDRQQSTEEAGVLLLWVIDASERSREEVDGEGGENGGQEGDHSASHLREFERVCARGQGPLAQPLLL